VLYDEHTIAALRKSPHGAYQALRVPGVESHRWLIKDKLGGDKVASKRCRKVYTLCFTARERPGLALKSEVGKSQIVKKAKPGKEWGEKLMKCAGQVARTFPLVPDVG
jgi:hypothetical protein